MWEQTVNFLPKLLLFRLKFVTIVAEMKTKRVFMRFLKENSYLIVRLLMTQIGMLVFATVLTVASVSFSGLLLTVSIFSVIFYMALSYVATWDRGAKDVLRVEAGRDTRRLYTGFLAGAFAAIPSLILTILMLVANLASLDAMYPVLRIILFIWQAPYTGIISTFFDGTALTVFGAAVAQETFYLLMTLAYFVALIPPVVGAGLGYIFGYKNYRIFGHLFDSAPKNKE